MRHVCCTLLAAASLLMLSRQIMHDRCSQISRAMSSLAPCSAALPPLMPPFLISSGSISTRPASQAVSATYS
jgi:hypothetical protein